jgi:hypothetical protein
MDNMDKLIFVNKNWPSNPWIGCLETTNFATTLEVEFELISKFEVEFEKQVDNFEGCLLKVESKIEQRKNYLKLRTIKYDKKNLHSNSLFRLGL